jgi:hypothetical protein
MKSFNICNEDLEQFGMISYHIETAIVTDFSEELAANF